MREHTDVTIKLASVLARQTGNPHEIGRPLHGGDTIESMLTDLDGQFPGIQAIVVCPDRMDIVDGINVYVNGDNVRYLQGTRTPLKPGDVVQIIPAAAAG